MEFALDAKVVLAGCVVPERGLRPLGAAAQKSLRAGLGNVPEWDPIHP